MKVYGIKQCDTCRKALAFLNDQSVEFEFVDLRQSPVASDTLKTWFSQLGADTLINRRSTTWRQLDESAREAVMGGDVSLLENHPTLIKRPLVEWGDEITVGFNPSSWRDQL
ncbi:MAG: Spx/MgsR family RNA polymerase-binding regulatory protein [Lysobacterales bacterium]